MTVMLSQDLMVIHIKCGSECLQMWQVKKQYVSSFIKNEDYNLITKFAKNLLGVSQNPTKTASSFTMFLTEMQHKLN